MKHLIKPFIVSGIILLLSVCSNAQIWAPSNARWYYSYSNFEIVGYVNIVNTADTLIYDNTNDKFRNCQILNKIFYSYNGITSAMDTTNLGSVYTCSNDDTVFIFKHNRFYVLYDFSAQPGDSWIVPESYNIGFCDSVGVVNVVSVGDTIINSESLRYIVVEPEYQTHWVMFGKIIEKIGPLWYMLPEQNCWLDFMEGGPLRCYQDNTFQFESGIAPYCDYLVGINETEKQYLNIFPNPATNFLTIECPTQELYNLEITNMYGKTLRKHLSFGNGAVINLTGFEPGLYILSLRNTTSNTLINKLLIINK